MAARRLKGDWMMDGYIQDLAPKYLDVIVLDGAAWSAECGQPEIRLTVDSDGELSGWGAVTFSPAAGELARIGLA